MTATIIESDTDQDTGLEEFISEQLDDAVPCDFESCEDEATHLMKFHCCPRKTFVCEDHMFFVYGEIKKMFNMTQNLGFSYWLCFECRGMHGSLKCFNAVSLGS